MAAGQVWCRRRDVRCSGQGSASRRRHARDFGQICRNCRRVDQKSTLYDVGHSGWIGFFVRLDVAALVGAVYWWLDWRLWFATLTVPALVGDEIGGQYLIWHRSAALSVMGRLLVRSHWSG